MTEKIQSIPARIKNIAKGGHVAGTEDIIDDASGKTQKEINTETGNKVDALQKQDIEVVTSLPAVSSADPKKIYRVAGETSYTDYMLNAAGSQFVAIATYSFPGIDDVPTAGSDNLVKSGGVEKFTANVVTVGKRFVYFYDFFVGTQKSAFTIRATGYVETVTNANSRVYYNTKLINKGAIMRFTGTLKTSTALFAVAFTSTPITDENLTTQQYTLLYRKTIDSDLDVSMIVPSDGYIIFCYVSNQMTLGSSNAYNISAVKNNDAIDISEINNGDVYTSLSDAISAIPAGLKRGGMEIIFKQQKDSGNQYVKYRLMKPTWSTTEADWQGVDDELIDGSNNLAKSGKVYESFKDLTKGYNLGIVVTEGVSTGGYDYAITGLSIPSGTVFKNTGDIKLNLLDRSYTEQGYQFVTIEAGESKILDFALWGVRIVGESGNYKLLAYADKDMLNISEIPNISEDVANLKTKVETHDDILIEKKKQITGETAPLCIGDDGLYINNGLNRYILEVTPGEVFYFGRSSSAVNYGRYAFLTTNDDAVAGGTPSYVDGTTFYNITSSTNNPKQVIIPEGCNFLTWNYNVNYVRCYKDFNKLEDIEHRTSELETKTDDISEDVEEIGKLKIPSFPNTFLPKKIYGVIGDTMQIFKRGFIISPNPYEVVSRFSCEQGKEFGRYLEITPALSGGSVPSNLTIAHRFIDRYYNQSEQIVSDFVIANKPVSPGSNINVLCIGASTTSGGEWPSELKRRLVGNGGTPIADGLTNISFVGRKQVLASERCPVDVKVEGTGGWTWGAFYVRHDAVRFEVNGVTAINVGDVYQYRNSSNQIVKVSVEEVNVTLDSGNIRCIYYFSTVGKGLPVNPSGTITKVSGAGDDTISYSSATEETYCPFYDEDNPDTKAKFTDYADAYCNGQIDVAIFDLGNVNEGIVGNSNVSGTISNMKVMLDGLHEDFPNCKVLIAPGSGYNTFNGVEYNYGAASRLRTWGLVFGQFRYAKAIEDFISDDSYKDWCFLVNSLAEIDAENVFPTSTKAVNTRVTDKYDVIGTNGVHPLLSGYQMMADAIYRCFVNVVL